MALAVLNQSTLITEAQARQMTTAVASQLYWHAGRSWSRPAPPMYYAKDKTAVGAADWTIVLLDDPDQAGALGWHTEDAGTVYGRVFARPVLQAGGDACSRLLSVSTVLSHEALETMFDWTANLWADDGHGTFWAYEVCDPVEGDSYPISVNGVTTMVSNFVLPSFFDAAGAPGKVDHMGTAPGPFQLAPHGYAVTATAAGQKQIFGQHYDAAVGGLYH